jgi:hypothetical protein
MAILEKAAMLGMYVNEKQSEGVGSTLSPQEPGKVQVRLLSPCFSLN